MNNTGLILVELQEYMGSDESIANAAWTSTYNKNQRDTKYVDKERVKELVPRLIREGHSVPVESVILRFWIRMPIFTDRQHMTHRVASHNGLSGRYRTMPEDWYGIPEDVAAILNKVNHKSEYDEICALAYASYKKDIIKLKEAEKQNVITNVEFKRAREILRAQLPTAGMVERTTILNLRSFSNYQRLRNSAHAQLEIKRVAELMYQEVRTNNIAPIAISTLEQIGWKI